MNYLSLCSGIEAATVAWHTLGWNPLAFSEIEAFPSAVLAHRFPQVPNLGDMTKYKRWKIGTPVDLIVAGTPCQSFSVAGLRKGMDDPRGNLALVFCGIIAVLRPRWVVWENVPGVLSSSGGRDFASFLGALAKLGYGWAYRVLDAQYFGVPQRRRRVFVVGHLGDWRPAAAVLFERYSLSGDPPPRREKGTRVTGTIADCANGGGANGPGRTVDSADTLVPEVAATVTPGIDGNRKGWAPMNETDNLVTQSLGCHRGGPDDNKAQGGFYVPEICAQAVSSKWSKGSSGPAGDEHHNLIAHTLRAEHDASEDGTGRGVPIVYENHGQDSRIKECRESVPQINAKSGTGGNNLPLIFTENQRNEIRELKVSGAVSSIRRGDAKNESLVMQSSVRRLTPRECERLQGFPDDWTNIPWRGKPESPDGPRYEAIGNSMAVPVMAWIGERIQMVENIKNEVAA